MAVASKPSLSFREKLSLLVGILIVYPYSLVSFILRNLFVRDRWWFRVKNAGSRCLTGSMTVKQLQYLFPSTLTVYKKWTRSKGLATNIEVLPAENDGEVEARIMWIGEAWRPGQKLLLYFHGGGYVLSMMKGHLGFLDFVKKTAGDSGLNDSLAIAVLEYTTAPAQKYPFQIREATQALSRLLARGIPPSDITISGDSAGGHLALSVVSHILHPRPTISKLSLDSPLAGLALISPATCISSTKASSFQKYGSIDVLDSAICQHWLSQMTDSLEFSADMASGNYWGEAAPAPESWWKGIGSVAKKILITAGEEEVLIDDIRVFIKTMEGVFEKEVGSFQLETLIAKGEVHDAPLMDFIINFKRSETTRKTAEFIVETFRTA
ncbi:Alpha/Beta hydrolase protein [Pyronema omphalodes]|nr:Alpha/Beta hydrolase protein [Pyronema omphalodes]